MGKQRDIRKQLEQVDQLLRSGRGRIARKQFKLIDVSRTSPSVATFYAELSRRIGLPSLGIKLLHKFVRPGNRKIREPTLEEVSEYASCLSGAGANLEAKSLLMEIDSTKVPQANLYLAYCYIRDWDYESSIAPLRRYLRCDSITEYQRLIARCNLLAGLVVIDDPQAQRLGQELLRDTAFEESSLLHLNVLVCLAQQSIERLAFSEAEKWLEKADAHCSDDIAVDKLFIEKWKAILEVKRRKGKARSFHVIKDVIAQAQQRRHWETIRDLEFQLGLLSGDHDVLCKVIIGTPYQAKRKQMCLSANVAMPTHYDWQLGTAKSFYYDTGTGEANVGKLKVGQTQFRMMMALSTDFYRPHSIPALHSLVFPGEYFNPHSSPARTYRVLERLRTWLLKQPHGLTIVEENNFYQFSGNGTILVTRHPVDSVSAFAKKLRSAFAESEFSSIQAAAFLNVSKRNAIYILNQLVAAGSLRRCGLARATRYQWGDKEKRTA